MKRILLSLLVICGALLAVDCCSGLKKKEKLSDIDSTLKTDVVKVADSINAIVTQPPITAVFMGSDGKTRRAYQITVVFYPDNRATLSDDENTYQLDQYVTADGYGYKDKKIDLRGKGNRAVLTYSDGLVLDLTEKSKSE